jgi:hypothetical protein
MVRLPALCTWQRCKQKLPPLGNDPWLKPNLRLKSSIVLLKKYIHKVGLGTASGKINATETSL